MTRSISYSEVNTAMTCQARWDFRYGGRLAGSALRPRLIAPRLSEGRAWGAAVAAYHSHGSELFAASEAYAALAASLQSDFADMREAGVPVITQDLLGAQERLEAILADYLERTKPIALTRLEDVLDVALPSRVGKRSSSRYRFEGHIDGWTRDEHDHTWIVEFKLRRKLTPAWLIALQPQTKWYAWALGRKQGSFPIGVLVEERFNEAPHPARILKSGLPSIDRAQITTGQLYRQACRAADVAADEDLAMHFDQRQWQQRVPILFRPGELEDAGNELVSAAKLVHQLDVGDLWPIRNASSAHCSGCSFREICASPMDDALVESLFERVPGKRNREPREPATPANQLSIYDVEPIGGKS